MKKSETDAAAAKAAGRVQMFLSSFVIGITNPAAIVTFLFAFSYFGIAGITGPCDGISLVCGVFIGTCLWWGSLSAATCAVRKKAGNRCFRDINRVFGTILSLFGGAIFVKAVLS